MRQNSLLRVGRAVTPALALILILLTNIGLAVQAGMGASTTVKSTPPRLVTGCAVNPATLTARGCSILRQDTAAAVDPKAGRWGKIECAADSRHRHIISGGDTHPKADGTRQRNSAYRRLTVIDGDDSSGERCQLGRNEWRFGENIGTQTSGTFALYEQGHRAITFFSMRQGPNFNPNVNAWQQIGQMKQAQPYTDSYAVALELQIYRGRLRLSTFWTDGWSTPAPANNVWVRYALDVVYSTDPTVGKVKLYADVNGDGDALDRGERSPRMNVRTLATDPSTGQPIPDVLMLGIYHNPSIDCPTPIGCQVDVDNIQVVR